MGRIGPAGAVALALATQGFVGAAPATAVGPTAVALNAAPSGATVTLYRMPRVLPTGGTGPLAADPFGNLWFNQTYEEPVEPGERPRHPGEIVRMTRDGAITVVAQKKRGGDFAIAPDGSIWFSGFHGIGHLALDGSLTEFPLPDGDERPNGPFRTTDEGPLVVAPNGDVWFTATRHLLDDEGREATSEPIIGRFSASGTLSEFDLPGGGGSRSAPTATSGSRPPRRCGSASSPPPGWSRSSRRCRNILSRETSSPAPMAPSGSRWKKKAR